jgi:hypothetical protein
MTNDLRTCQGCGYQTHEVLTHCPRCQRPLMPARHIRRLGWVLVVIGLFLIARANWQDNLSWRHWWEQIQRFWPIALGALLAAQLAELPVPRKAA